MAIRKVAIGFLLVLALCCTKRPSFTQQVIKAHQRWEQAVCRTPRYNTLIRVPEIVVCGILKDTVIYGCYDRSSGQITISQVVPEEDVYWVITHEMGHSLAPGKHVADGAGLMSQSKARSKPYITDADLDMICEEYECPCRNPEKP